MDILESPKYYTSFNINQKEEYKAYFDKYGFVVVDNVLSMEECLASQAEVWSFLSKRGVSQEEPKTWENDTWPKEICRNGGFMGRFPYFNKLKSLDDLDIPSQVQAWKNRQNPEAFQIFSKLMETDRLWVSIDRYGVMRPTVLNQPATSEEGEAPKAKSEIKSDWKTKEDWLHWDLSPFHFGTSAAGFGPSTKLTNEDLKHTYGRIRVQGLVTLVDCPVEAGGFHCVPEFVDDTFFQWGKDNQDYGNQDSIKKRNFIEVPENDPMRKRITKIPMKAGSLLVWNSQLPHGNFPNTGEHFRMVQYIKMIPVDDPREFIPATHTEKHGKDEYFPEGFEPSELGRKLFGLDPYAELQTL